SHSSSTFHLLERGCRWEPPTATVSKRSKFRQMRGQTWPDVWHSDRLVRDDLELDLDIEHETDREYRPNRGGLGEIAAIDLVEPHEVADIGKPSLAIDDILERAAGGRQGLFHESECQMHLLIERHVLAAGAIIDDAPIRTEHDFPGIESPWAIGGR